MTVIATESLSKRFPRVTALDRLSVDVGPGVTGLVGANGAGKSTLIKILLGLSPATEGRAEVLGLDVATEGAAIRERVGYMPDVLGVYDATTVEEYLQFFAGAYRIPRKQWPGLFDGLLRRAAG